MTNSLFQLPTEDEMYAAFKRKDTEFEGVFFLGVRTTGIFCRPGCPARLPKRENVQFFGSTADALSSGFRPCKRCRPLECFGQPPIWLRELLDAVEADPSHRWTDQDLRDAELEPTRVRRWFKQNHGLTFHGYLRARRLGKAFGQIKVGTANATNAAFDVGYESVSGFREAFQKWFQGNPSDVRESDSPIVVSRVLSQLGPLIVAAIDDRICLLEFANRRMLETQFKRVQKAFRRQVVPGDHKLFAVVQKQLDEYFAGIRKQFEFPMATDGTEFQNRVWEQLAKIPYGETTSYDEIARRLKKPKAQRAVGTANGDNRLAIVIPCHRVIRSNGELSGYGGGVWRKKWLLDLEQSNA